MDSLLKVPAQKRSPTGAFELPSTALQRHTVLPASSYEDGTPQDIVTIDRASQRKVLSVSAEQILGRLRERLGIVSLDELQHHDNYTPEKTADFIVKGISLLFDRFSSQNPSLSGEALITEFFKRAHSGIAAGYTDALQTLEDTGATELEGIRNTAAETKKLIDEKMVQFERLKREQLGLAPLEAENQVADEIAPHKAPKHSLSVMA
jgi:hypothetical protein